MELTLNIPHQVDATEFDVKMSLASKLYEDGRASMGYAAQIAGLSKRAFIEMLGKYNVSVFQHEAGEILKGVHSAC
ncbi:MAG: UPF0175 family protein [Treponema sp.]|jgi:predicted HTH domain antitoxin|nr:UPF0175 family protein [Treponema sp.]